MGCQCLVTIIKYLAVGVVVHRLLTAIFNIVGPYLLFSPIDLKKRAGASWAVVTGGTDGIGKAYAFELARRGFNVFIVSRTESKLDETKKEILEMYGDVEVRTYSYDFTNASVSGYNELLVKLNKVEIGILVNNVGLSYEYPEILRKVEGGVERLTNITTITLPPTVLSAGILPQMVARQAGIIVNVAAPVGANQLALWAVYSATKKYVSWLSAILRREYESQGITVQAISPMLVATEMSTVKETSFFTPDGAVFARAAIGSIGHANDTTGYFSHQIQLELIELLPEFVKCYILDMLTDGTAASLRKKAIEPQMSEQQNNSYSWNKYDSLAMMYNEFDVVVNDIDEQKLESIGICCEIENLSAGVFTSPAFPVHGHVSNSNNRFMVPLVCQWAAKPDKPSVIVWFLVATGSPFTCLTVRSVKEIFGDNKEIKERSLFRTAIQDQNSHIDCQVSKDHFKEVNILGADAILALGVSIKVTSCYDFQLIKL